MVLFLRATGLMESVVQGGTIYWPDPCPGPLEVSDLISWRRLIVLGYRNCQGGSTLPKAS